MLYPTIQRVGSLPLCVDPRAELANMAIELAHKELWRLKYGFSVYVAIEGRVDGKTLYGHCILVPDGPAAYIFAGTSSERNFAAAVYIINRRAELRRR